MASGVWPEAEANSLLKELTDSLHSYTFAPNDMPTKHASIKDLRKSAKRHAKNVSIRMHVKQTLRTSKELLAKGDVAGAKKAAAKFQQIADKAAKNHAISINAARRRKSAIMKTISRVEKK